MVTAPEILGLAAQMVADNNTYSVGGVMRDADGQPCGIDRACRWDIHGAVQHVAATSGLTYRSRAVQDAVRVLSEVARERGYDNITAAGDDQAHLFCRGTAAGLFSDALDELGYGQCGVCGEVEEDVYGCESCYRVGVCSECVIFEDTVPFYDGEGSICPKCAADHHKESWARYDRLVVIFGQRIAGWMASEWDRREEERYKVLYRCTACGKTSFDDHSRYAITGGVWWCSCIHSQTKHVRDHDTKLNPATGRPYGEQEAFSW